LVKKGRRLDPPFNNENFSVAFQQPNGPPYRTRRQLKSSKPYIALRNLFVLLVVKQEETFESCRNYNKNTQILFFIQKKIRVNEVVVFGAFLNITVRKEIGSITIPKRKVLHLLS